MDSKIENIKLDHNTEDSKSLIDDKNVELTTDKESEPSTKKLKLIDNEKNETTKSVETEGNETTKSSKTEESESKSSETEENKLKSSETEKDEIDLLLEFITLREQRECSASSEYKESEPSTSKYKETEPTSSKNEDDEDSMSDENDIPPEGFIYPLETDASDMLDEVDFDDNGHFPTVTERYFTPYYELDVLKPGDDICIRIHSNRICMISLAPSHIIFQENKTIQSCNFKVSDKLDRTKNKVSGKSKHGAQPLQSNSNLCCLTCSDGSSYMVKCCMIGKLIEVNERLVEDPELLKKEPHFGGYIAIVLPNLKHLEKRRETLLNQQLYEEAIKKREETKKQQKEQIISMEIVEVNKNKEIDQVTGTEVIEKEEQSEQVLIPESVKNKEHEKEELVSMETVEIEQDKKQCINIDTTANVKIEPKKEGIVNMEIVES